MLFTEQLPELPEGEGSLWTHDTSGEHAHKFVNTGGEFNRIRRENLTPPPESLSDNELFDMMFEDGQEVVFVRHIPEGTGNVMGLVAGVISKQEKVPEEFKFKITIEELVVDPSFRNRGIGGWLVSRSLTRIDYQSPWRPTELTIDNTQFKLTDRFPESLSEMGFKPSQEDGCPTLWLPGMTLHPPFDDYNDPVNLPEIERAVDSMPNGWNGYLPFSIEQDDRTRYYRSGVLVGMVEIIENTTNYDNQTGKHISDCLVYDSDSNEVTKLNGVSSDQGAIYALNKI